MMLKIELLGHFHLSYGGETVNTISAPKRQLLLAYLLLHPDAALSRRRLAVHFWPDSIGSQALTNLRKQLHHLRRELPQSDQFLQIDPHTVQWCADAPYSLDVDRFEEAIAQAAEAGDDAATARARLEEAVAYYQGDLLPGSYAEWLYNRRARLRRQYLEALERLLVLLAEQSALAAAVRYGRRLLAEAPLRERAYRRLMRLHARQGDRARAVEVYQACVEVLQQKLNTLPSRATRRVYERDVLKAEPARHNLPARPRPLIGRKQELAEIGARLGRSDCRLLTLVGPPGVGKSRLALAAARGAVGRFLHGITFIPLAPLSAPGLLPATIADALGLKQASEATRAQLLAYLEGREMLLLLDNFEHLMAAVDLLDEILSRAPGVQLLVTSRQRLNLQWEWLLVLDGLACPAGPETEEPRQFAAVQLFSHQARRLRPDAPLDEAELRCAAEICRLVAGNPLAILLATAAVGSRSCPEIAAQIRHNMATLKAPWHDVPERHRSLYAAVAHSWSLLSPAEQQVFAGLSVFRGGFREAAAQEVAGAAGPVLAALVEKSLLQHTHAERYDLHEMVRQFAAAKLGERTAAQAAVHEAYASYYAAFLQRMERQLRGEGQRQALQRVAEELDNVRLAWHRAVAEADAARIRQAGDGLFLFYEMQTRYREAREMFAAAAAALEEAGGKEGEALALSLVYRGWFISYLGNVEKGTALMRRGRALARKSGDGLHEAMADYGLGIAAYAGGALVEAERLFRAALAFFREAGYRASSAHALNYCGSIAERRGEPDRAEQLHKESLSLHEAVGDEWGIGRTFFHLGEVAAQRGDFQQAREWLDRSLEILRRFEDDRGVIFALILLAESRRQTGRVARAREAITEAVAVSVELGEKNLQVRSRRNLAEICLEMNETQQAKAQLQQALALAADGAAQPRLADLLVTFARLFLGQGQEEEALALLAYVAAQPQTEARTRQQARRLAAQAGVADFPEDLPAPPELEISQLLATLAASGES